MIRRPSFDDLSPEKQAHFGNGIGPDWMPAWLRTTTTGGARWVFRDASWRHHDFGYAVGGDRWDRARCDWKFLVAMIDDALTQEARTEVLAWLLIPPAVLISLVFYLAVRLGGQFGSFEYRDGYASLEEVLAAYGTKDTEAQEMAT